MFYLHEQERNAVGIETIIFDLIYSDLPILPTYGKLTSYSLGVWSARSVGSAAFSAPRLDTGAK